MKISRYITLHLNAVHVCVHMQFNVVWKMNNYERWRKYQTRLIFEKHTHWGLPFLNITPTRVLTLVEKSTHWGGTYRHIIYGCAPPGWNTERNSLNYHIIAKTIVEYRTSSHLEIQNSWTFGPRTTCLNMVLPKATLLSCARFTCDTYSNFFLLLLND